MRKHDLEPAWVRKAFSPGVLRDARFEPDRFSSWQRAVLWYELLCKWVTVGCFGAMNLVPDILVDMVSFYLCSVWVVALVLMWSVFHRPWSMIPWNIGWTLAHVAAIYASLMGFFFVTFPIFTYWHLPAAGPHLITQEYGFADLNVHGVPKRIPRFKIKRSFESYIAIARDEDHKVFGNRPYQMSPKADNGFPYLNSAKRLPFTNDLYVVHVTDD